MASPDFLFTNPLYASRDAQTSSPPEAQAGREAVQLLAAMFAYRPTPLRSLNELARDCGLASIALKDEGARLGLKSFKALGGAYAVISLVLDRAAAQLGRRVGPGELPHPASGSLALPPPGSADTPAAPEVAQVAARMTFTCATDGNHGLSVAAGARLVGARAVIFVHEGVSVERCAAIEAFGARLSVVAGSYDDAVAEALRQSGKHGWLLVSDTSWNGYREIPGLVMKGYAVMVHELIAQLAAPPTHVFLQAGVGGFAAAVTTALQDCYRQGPPRVVVVEPARAACLFASARAGRSVKLTAGEATVMAMLECYEPSLIAWESLRQSAAAFMTIEDRDALQAMQVLAQLPPQQATVAGESGAAGLAGLLAACRDPRARAALCLDAASRVLVINTEGATDAARYQAAVGATPSGIAARIATGMHINQ
jgi:diaminopropionate ammonia-lyase